MQRIAVIIAIVTATVILPVAAQEQTKDDFEYWDLNGNSDLTCTEASGKDEGLKLPAYRDNRDGTGLIYEWLQRQRSSDTDNDGIACDSPSNPNGYVPRAGSTTPPPTNARECPAGSPTWMDLSVCEEGARVSYDRDAFGSAYSSLEDEIIDALPKSDGQVYTPYTCTLFDIQADGTAATDIEHIVALAEAYDSGLAESQFRTFAGDIDNLTIADPTVNRRQKSDLDAGEWEPPENRGWFAARVVAVKQKYGLSVNPAERDALQSMLNSDPSRTVTCGGGLVEVVSAQHKYIFPQFAFGGGWESTLMVQALGSNTTCTFSAQDRSFTMRDPYGNNLSGTQQQLILGMNGWTILKTATPQGMAASSGMAVLDCDEEVSANTLFSLEVGGSLVAEALVESSEEIVSGEPAAQFLADHRDGARFAVAVANPSNQPLDVLIAVGDLGGQQIGEVTVNVPANAAQAFFVDELVTIPTGHTGQVLIRPSNNPGPSVYVVGLRVTGLVITTIPATVVPSPTKPFNQLQTERLIGTWEFSYTISFSEFTDTYRLSNVRENTITPGKWFISGTGQSGDLVIAEYSPALGMFSLLDPGTLIDRFFTFDFVGSNTVSGCYYQVRVADDSFSRCYNMTGVRTSSTALTSLTTARPSTTAAQAERDEIREAERLRNEVQIEVDPKIIKVLKDLRESLPQ